MVAAVLAARGQRRKEIVNSGDRPPPRLLSDQQILLHRQRREDFPFLWYQTDAEACPLIRRQCRDIAPGKADASSAEQRVPHDRRQQGRLADPVFFYNRKCTT